MLTAYSVKEILLLANVPASGYRPQWGIRPYLQYQTKYKGYNTTQNKVISGQDEKLDRHPSKRRYAP